MKRDRHFRCAISGWQELESFRSRFHKSVIYANRDLEATLLGTLHQAGVQSFEERSAARRKQMQAFAKHEV